ncbi:hypothetical protein MLD38_013870 [Melastoma candidum]|uniref:Uncharacterized protein n=1 Tax=Melastoma candidum TaxID=119954 RepID=A0ACB9RCU8_9MYRT|nr:hypothetical protein MLD38_013870 [Melastoma candidum]
MKLVLGMATGLLICGPLMSVCDRHGCHRSRELSIELSALGDDSNILHVYHTEYMHWVLIPRFIALIITQPTHSLEGWTGSWIYQCLDVRMLFSRQFGSVAVGDWACQDVGLPWPDFNGHHILLALRHLTSSESVLYTEHLDHIRLEKLKAA